MVGSMGCGSASLDEDQMPELAEKGQALTPQTMHFCAMGLLFTDTLSMHQDYKYFGKQAFPIVQAHLLAYTSQMTTYGPALWAG